MNTARVAALTPTFSPTWNSLVDGYRTPNWFRDAKSGICARWNAQCVPEAGDGYARNMLLEKLSSYA
jgi:alpha-L-fucosidase